MAKRKINKSGNVILFKNQTRDDFENNDSLPTTSSFNETSWVDIDPTPIHNNRVEEAQDGQHELDDDILEKNLDHGDQEEEVEQPILLHK